MTSPLQPMGEIPREIAFLYEAASALERAESVSEVKDIRDRATAVQTYAQQADHAGAIARKAAELRVRAERRGGELLAAMGIPAGRRPTEKWCPRGTVSVAVPTLQELGVTKKQSSHWQAIASIPRQAFEDHVRESERSGRPLTTSAAVRLGRALAAAAPVGFDTVEAVPSGAEIVDDLEDLVGAGRKFGCIYADPPWTYTNDKVRGAASNHYATLTLDELAALPVGALAAEDAQLHLWATSPLLLDAADLLRRWGFAYKSHFVWAKPQLGLGSYWRVSHEVLLLGVRGRATFAHRDLRSWAEFPRTEHSAKPAEMRSFVEAASPGPRLELFAREAVAGWTSWGNQVGRAAARSGKSSERRTD